MTKEILLSLVYNASTQLSNEIAELNDDILFLENELNIRKDKKIYGIGKRRWKGRKKKKYEKLNEFLSKYIMFLLDERKNEFTSSHNEHKLKKDINIKQLIENMNKTSVNYEQGNISMLNTTMLNEMYQKRNTLKDILKLIQMNSIQNLSDEKSQKLFLDLLNKMKDINKSYKIEEDKENKLISSNRINKSKIDMKKSGKDINKVGKQFVDYLNSTNEEIWGGVEGSSTAPSTTSFVDSNSERMSDSERMSISINARKQFFLNGVGDVMTGIGENEEVKKVGRKGKCDKYDSNSTNEHRNGTKIEKENSSIFDSCTHHESLNNFFLNDKLKTTENEHTLSSKDSWIRKSFSNTEKKCPTLLMDNEKFNKQRIFHTLVREKTKLNSNIILKSESDENSNNYLTTFMNTNENRRSVKCKPKVVISPFPPSLNRNNKNVQPERINATNDKEEKRKNRSSSSSSFSSSCSSSDSKGSECASNNPRNHFGKKRYLFRINKNGIGSFLVNKEEGKSRSYVYDFELVYDDSDLGTGTDIRGGKRRTNEETNGEANREANGEANREANGEANREANGEVNKEAVNITSKEMKIFHFSFLKRGKKICGVNNLYMAKDKVVRLLQFLDGINSNNENVNIFKGGKNDDRQIQYNDIDEEEGKKKKINLLEENIKNLREENFRRKYELTRIIDDIRNKKHFSSNEIGSYNMEFIETNRLRGLYIQLLDKQSQLERDKNFYKNELEKLKEDIKNDRAPIADFLKEEKNKYIEREKIFYKKEKRFLKIKNQLKKKVIELENALELTQDQLSLEKGLNENLHVRIEENRIILEKKESETNNTNKMNESKISTLNTEREQLRESIKMEIKEKEKLIEEITMLKKDQTFENFRKVVLHKITKTNGDIKYLAEILELLTKELEQKIIQENKSSKEVEELQESYQKNVELLNITKTQLGEDKKKIKNLNEQISYLSEKNTNLIESIKYLLLQNSEKGKKKETSTEECFLFSDDERKRRKEKLTHDSKYSGQYEDKYEDKYAIPHISNYGKKRCSKNKQSVTVFSDNSSRSSFLYNNSDTKSSNSFEELMNSVNEPFLAYRGLIKHNIV
ncbi:hypothetical protein MKS88_001927 [Plasmodium brasilianum]|uniref:Uncharacterized protein n=1 Tax=Plasmodium brasilianum TaxID=5824 RepID=A0ACB9YCT0_PLABR|nr:hypothetical protein MKS88_001927 [Plasmodium brasilianum]